MQTTARATAAIVSTFILSSVASAAGRSIYVTTDGTESASCGAQTSACRSISQGLENATDGDTILVGAGRYGNISGGTSYTGPGDEHPEARDRYFFVTGCIICIEKAVSIYSLHGPSVTVIEGAPLTSQEATVLIHHEGVNFGAPGRGFTIAGGSAYGVLFDEEEQYGGFGIHLKSNVSIAGNVDLGDADGFAFMGRGYTDTVCPVDDCLPTATITYAQNDSVDNSHAAFNISQNLFLGTGSVVVQNNYARGAGIGFDVPGGGQSAQGLYPVTSGRISLTGNVAEHNTLGFHAVAPGSVISNTAAGNSQAGFHVVAGQGATGQTAAFQNNTAVGNAGPGAIVQFFSDGRDPPSLLSFQSFTKNNFYGNDRHRPSLSIQISQDMNVQFDPGPSAHCGVLNLGQLVAYFDAVPNPPMVAPLNATGNFWGTTHGPAPTGASDAVGGACDQHGGKTTETFYASAGFAITTH
jgi:hypothetical protein